MFIVRKVKRVKIYIRAFHKKLTTVNDSAPNIWQLQAKSEVDGLVAALQHSDASIRKRAAAALRTLGAVRAIPALEKQMTTEQDAEVRTVFAAVLESLLAEQGPVRRAETRRLIEQLKSEDLGLVIKAARGLGALKDKTAVESLVMVFHNTHMPGKVRLAAAEALIELESAPAVVTLLAALRSKEWTIRRNAAAVLGQLQAEWAVGPLMECLSDEHDLVRRTARAALKRIGTTETLPDTGMLMSAKAQTARLPDTEPLKPDALRERSSTEPETPPTSTVPTSSGTE